MKQIEVTILGHSYILGCPEGGEASLVEAVTLVDREMSAIRDAGKVKARERIAVLAALNLAFQLAEDSNAEAAVQQRPSAPVATAAARSSSQPSDAEVTALISRIDQTLSTDGQLL